MCSFHFLHIFLTGFAFAHTALASANGQFVHWFDGMDEKVSSILETHCSKPFKEVQANPRFGGDRIVDCILEYLEESKKAEMAIVSVILGLLPIAMQLIGPKVSDVCALTLRRPALAVLIAIGSPCTALEYGRTGLELADNSGECLWPERLRQPSVWIQTAISLSEYIVVMLAATNSIFQAHGLTFRAVALVSTITGTYGNKPEGFSPLLWIFLPIPIYALGVATLVLRKPSNAEESHGPTKLSFRSRISSTSKKLLIREFTPCAFITPAAQTASTKVRPTYILLSLNWLMKLGVWVDTIYGVIVLSSILFLSLFDALELIGRYLGGCLLCRLVVAFEIYGLEHVSSESNEEGATHSFDDPMAENGRAVGSPRRTV